MLTISSFLPFLLFCLTIHACKARYLGVIVKDCSKQAQLSVKEVEKERLVKTSLASEVVISKSAELQSIISEVKGGPTTQKPKDLLRVHHTKVKKKRGKVAAALSQVQSLVSVSWHVSHTKQKGHPGFNLDYAPPKTHPPHNN